MPMMGQDNIVCSNCEKLFNINSCDNIYLCGDTYLCSYNCSKERYRDLRNLDPGLARPHTWPLLKSTSTPSLFNYELALKSKKDALSNRNEHIVKNQKKYSDVVLEEDETEPLIIENIDDEKPCQINYDEIKQECCSQICRQRIIFGVSALCLICIMTLTIL
tara:strand:+ start:86 stop:571 length:486 start_codon:yes stop_codon:yes gene_type:complete